MSREDIIRDIQDRFRQVGRSFNELARRRWAAMEAVALGRGGIGIVSQALRMSPNTIKRGIQELLADGQERSPANDSRIRRSGGGRKSNTRRSLD